MRCRPRGFLLGLAACSAQCIKNSCVPSTSSSPTTSPTSLEEHACLVAHTAPLKEDEWDEAMVGHARSLKCAHQLVGVAQGNYTRAIAYLWCMIDHTVLCDTDDACPCADAGPTFQSWGGDRCRSEIYELLGFCFRKQTEPDYVTSRSYYEQALALAPHSCEVRSYYAELAATVDDENNASQALAAACALCGASHAFVQPPLDLYTELYERAPCECLGCGWGNRTVRVELRVQPANTTACATNALATIPALGPIINASFTGGGRLAILAAAPAILSEIYVDALREAIFNAMATGDLHRAFAESCNVSTASLDLLRVGYRDAREDESASTRAPSAASTRVSSTEPSPSPTRVPSAALTASPSLSPIYPSTTTAPSYDDDASDAAYSIFPLGLATGRIIGSVLFLTYAFLSLVEGCFLCMT